MIPKSLQIVEVNSPKNWNLFFRLPWNIYSGDNSWVPPLITEQKKMLDIKNNPFFMHAHYKAWLVFEGNQVAGRILAYVDTRYNLHHQDKTGFFGFFESPNNQGAADLLFYGAAGWLTEQGMCNMRGPINLDITNECGVLLSGFEYAPCLQMNHTPPYYQQLFEQFHFKKAHDLLAYRLSKHMILGNKELLPKLKRISEKVLQREKVEFRTINMKKFDEEMENINNLYNGFMDKNWGFTPSTMEDMRNAGKSLRQIVNPKMIFFAEVNNKVAGCSISLPDINQVLLHLNGYLFPLGIFKFLYYRPKINRMRLILLGVKKEFRFRGLDILFYYYTVQKAFENGFQESELSWISEDNNILISIVKKFGAHLYKRYRVYEKEL